MTFYFDRNLLLNFKDENDEQSVLIRLLSHFNTTVAKVWKTTPWSQLKNEWSKKTNIPVTQFQFLYAGKELNDNDTVGNLVQQNVFVIEVKLNLDGNHELSGDLLSVDSIVWKLSIIV